MLNFNGSVWHEEAEDDGVSDGDSTAGGRGLSFGNGVVVAVGSSGVAPGIGGAVSLLVVSSELRSEALPLPLPEALSLTLLAAVEPGSEAFSLRAGIS